MTDAETVQAVAREQWAAATDQQKAVISIGMTPIELTTDSRIQDIPDRHRLHAVALARCAGERMRV